MCTNFLKLPHWINAHHSFLCQAYKDSLMHWAEQQGLKECSLCTEQYSEKPSGMGAAVCPCGWELPCWIHHQNPLCPLMVLFRSHAAHGDRLKMGQKQ